MIHVPNHHTFVVTCSVPESEELLTYQMSSLSDTGGYRPYGSSQTILRRLTGFHNDKSLLSLMKDVLTTVTNEDVHLLLKFSVL